MKTIKIITLFPELFSGFMTTSIIKKAITNQKVGIEIINLRDFALGKHRQVDDYQYGGGTGMVLMAPVVVAAIKKAQSESPNNKVILLTPQGKVFNQEMAGSFANDHDTLILVCGNYEGFDERVNDFIDFEISIGDYVLSGGGLASMVVTDAITRLIPGVIQEESHRNDSFTNNYLDHPVYTKPLVFNNHQVPDVLLSGHHKHIAEWRQEQAFNNTYKKRPDLIDFKKLNSQEQKWLAGLEKTPKKEG